MKLVRSILLAGVCLAGSAATAADLRIIVPFPAGGPTDVAARQIAAELRTELNTAVIVENRSGAGGTIGSRQVASMPPDGTAILLATLGSQVIAPLLNPEAGYHPSDSFDTLALAGVIQIGMVVRPDLPAKDLKSLVELARSSGKLTYGSAGVGTTTHIAAETLNAQADGRITHVPYRGGVPAVTDLIGGHVDLYTGDIPTLATFLRAGSVRPIAVLDAKRSTLFPDIPTTAELGYPNVVMNNWYGFLAPKGLEPATRKRLENALLKVMKMKNVEAALHENGVVGPQDAAEFERILNNEVTRWPPFLKERKITAG